MQIYYLKNNKKLKTSVSNSDMEVFSTHRHARHVVKIKAKKDLTLLKADHKIAFFVNYKDKYFLNGYQSWTDTAEYYLSKRERNIKKSPHIISHMFAMDKYGDSSFYRYSSRKSHGYDVFYSKGRFESFLYSLNYQTAYLIIELIKDQRCLHLVSDVNGIILKEGEEATIFDYRFFNSYEEGIEEFNEDFPLLNKEKIFGYTSWYNYYQHINEEIIYRDLEALDNRFNVFQIDDGYETYGCYLFPPFVNGMYAGNFWWTRADYFSKLDALDNKTKADNRFKAEVWLLTKSRKPFSAFDTVADLYFVNITPDIYSSERHSIWASFRFFCIYTFRKYQKKWFGYSYKKHCQERFQKLKAEVRTAPNR